MSKVKPGEWLRARDAIKFLREGGYSISDQGVRKASITHQFSRRDINGGWWFSREGLQKYLDAVTSVDPPGWASVSDAAEAVGVTPPTIYDWIKRGLLVSQIVGPRQGAHVEIAEAIRVRDRFNTERTDAQAYY